MAISKKRRFEVLERDAFTCQYCGRSAPEVKLHVDHSVPVAYEHDDSDENLITACVDCNAGKSACVAARMLLRLRYLRSCTSRMEGALASGDADRFRDALFELASVRPVAKWMPGGVMEARGGKHFTKAISELEAEIMRSRRVN